MSWTRCSYCHEQYDAGDERQYGEHYAGRCLGGVVAATQQPAERARLSDDELKAAVIDRLTTDVPDAGADAIVAAAEAVDFWSALLICSAAALGLEVLRRRFDPKA